MMGRGDRTGATPPPGGRTVFPEEFPEGLKPRLRLFLSVDLVGGTAYKQSRSAWRPEILHFYRNFDFVLRAQHKAITGGRRGPLPAPEFWKSNGDELLYVCELQSLDQAHGLMRVWLAALEGYRSEFAEDGQGHLDVKSTAWIGLFPLPNCEVFFHRGGGQGPDIAKDPVLAQSELRDEWYASGGVGPITRDFVGPSIDTGFRLTSWATPRRLILSVDLAFLLTNSCQPDITPLRLHVSGWQTLRGVVGDEPYPTLWAPVGGGPVGSSGVGSAATDWPTIRACCEAMIEQNHSSITPFFLTASTRHEDFDWAPPYILSRILRLWEDERRYRAEAEAAAPGLRVA